MKSNCLFFATALWFRCFRRARRRAKQGKPARKETYLVFRLSRIPWGLFHVLHGKLDTATGQIKLVSYKPEVQKKTRPAPFFKGRVKRGD